MKVDRDEVFVELTKSVCPVCRRVLDAEVNIRAGGVYLRRTCPDHGRFEALTCSDAEWYLASLRLNKPGTLPLQFATEVVAGCPSDCGLCPDHKQHTCLALIEVNSNCNLDCPLCFADSGHQSHGFQLTVEQVKYMVGCYVAAEGNPEAVQLSGGEPTIHPQILDLVDVCRDAGIRHVMVNTNGIRLARDRGFAQELAERGAHIYLQFDGFDAATHVALRGRDLRDLKERALDRCVEAGLSVTLVAAVQRGLNEHEVGDIVRFGVRHKAVNSVVFQPVTNAGRHHVFDPLTRLTNPDVMRMITDQVPEWFRRSDFVPVPCCFPTCRSVTYALVDGETVVPLPRLLDVESHLDYVSNRMIPDASVLAALERMWSASAVPGSAELADNLECATCAIDIPAALSDLRHRAFMLVVQDFQDAYTLNVRQLKKCCVAELTPDGRQIPFCAYNSVGYREQVRSQLTGVPVDLAVPNAAPLQPGLRVGANGSTVWRDNA
ncbi:MAG: radical SAM protein [Solirubrobacterales bacterium]